MLNDSMGWKRFVLEMLKDGERPAVDVNNAYYKAFGPVVAFSGCSQAITWLENQGLIEGRSGDRGQTHLIRLTDAGRAALAAFGDAPRQWVDPAR